ncbi:MAG: glycosyl hydrolase, partial [Ectothiorhodospiraceae bacterium]|nr:glycosyl hydrolase [Ectothiorhodospiraceae bacterium]
KNASTSLYGNIVALDESPLQQGLLYVGTDDGLIQVTENDGANWRKISSIPGIPELAYVSHVEASEHDPNTVYATFSNHKMADFKPYVMRSTDRGATWTPITEGLPENSPCWVIKEDDEKQGLLFLGAEFGMYFSTNNGGKWTRLKGGLPTIAVRDISLQRRENDIVLGTFGRGIYILDDYSPLRNLTDDALNSEAHIFPVKDALMYIERTDRHIGAQGGSFFTSDNPPYGAVFTYYIKDSHKSLADLRRKAEKKARKDGGEIDYPDMEELRAEHDEDEPFLLFTVTSESGEVVRRLTAPVKKGVHRIAWDLRYPDLSPLASEKHLTRSGLHVLPGTYNVSLAKFDEGEWTQLAGPQGFTVKPLDNTTLPSTNRKAMVAFQKKAAQLQRSIEAASKTVDETAERLKKIGYTLRMTPEADSTLLATHTELTDRLTALRRELRGDDVASKHNANQKPSIANRVGLMMYQMTATTSDPTAEHQEAYNIASKAMIEFSEKLRALIEGELEPLERQLDEIDAPWTPGRLPDWRPR